MTINNQHKLTVPVFLTKTVGFFLIAIVIALILPALPARADFCWSSSKIESCVTDVNNTYLLLNKKLGIIDLNNDLTFVAEPVYFVSDLPEGFQESTTRITMVRFSGNDGYSEYNSSDKNTHLNVDFIFNDNEILQRNDWSVGKSEVNRKLQSSNDPEMGVMKARIILSKSDSKILEPGSYTFQFAVRGESRTDSSVYFHDLIYEFSFEVPKSVAISGLDPVNLGAFSTYKNNNQHAQRFCIAVNGNNEFRVRAESTNGGQLFYMINNDDPSATVNYKPELAMKSSNAFFTLTTDYRSTDGLDNKLKGVTSCSSGGNMILKVSLPETNSELIGKKAGKYSDTLYIEVAAN